MVKVIYISIATFLTIIPVFLRFFCKRKFEKKIEKLREQEDGCYCHCIFFGPANFNCKPHLQKKTPCGEFCSYMQLQRLLHYINSAKRSISMCMYMLTLKQVVITLIAAHKRGVKVRIITDSVMIKTEVSQHNFKILRENGIQYKTNNSCEEYMHHKYCLIDESNKESAKAFFGSANLTAQAVCMNFESMILTNNWMIIQRLSEDFEDLWNMFEEQ